MYKTDKNASSYSVGKLLVEQRKISKSSEVLHEMRVLPFNLLHLVKIPSPIYNDANSYNYDNRLAQLVQQQIRKCT